MTKSVRPKEDRNSHRNWEIRPLEFGFASDLVIKVSDLVVR